MQELQHQQEAGKYKVYAENQTSSSGQEAPAQQKYNMYKNNCIHCKILSLKHCKVKKN